MKPRSLAALGLLLLLGSATRAQAPAKSTFPSQPAAPPIPAVQILNPDGTPDTTHYLPDSTIIGRIDNRVFRVADFVDRWFSSYLLDRPRPDSAGRYEFLNAMVNKEVLADLARQANRPLTFEDRATLRETRQRLLSNAVFARLVSDSVHYTNDEVRHLYEQGRHQLHLQRIVVNDPATADQAWTDVVEKRLSWAEAVQRYSKDPEAKGPQGDMGWVKRDGLYPAVALVVFDLPDGGISPVFRDGRTTWWFARVAERRPNQQPLLQHLGKLLAKEVLAVKLSQRTEIIRDHLRRRLGMAYDSTNIYWAAALFAAKEREVQGDDPTPVLDMTAHIPDFQPADTSRVLARWNQGSFSLGAFLADYNATPVPQRDKLGTFDAFRAVLDRYALEPYMAQMGEELGLAGDPIVVAGLTRKEEQLRIEHLFADSIESRAWVSREERQKYYEDHLPDYFGLQSVTYATFGRISKTGVDSLVQQLKAGVRAADILRADSLAGTYPGSIRTESERDGGEFHQLLFDELREGDIRVLGPNGKNEYLIFQKLEHDPGHQLPLEEVQSLVDESLQNFKAEQMLKDLIARYRPLHVVELHPELLMRFRLEDPHE